MSILSSKSKHSSSKQQINARVLESVFLGFFEKPLIDETPCCVFIPNINYNQLTKLGS